MRTRHFDRRGDVHGAKGTVWFCDGSGQVLQGKLVDYDRSQGTFWVHAHHNVPLQATMVVILKNGDLFPTGKPEWCGTTLLVSKENPGPLEEGAYLYCLRAATS
jgi:hypothetical protein